MKTRLIMTVAALILLAVSPSWSTPNTTTTETFDGTVEEASWRVAEFDAIAPTGGNPGAYLRVDGLDSAIPRIFTFGTLAQNFLGDYRSKAVTGLGVDVKLFAIDFTAQGRPVSLVLSSDMGTPEDTSDDCDAWLVGQKTVPRPGAAWKRFNFKVASQSTTLPHGWVLVGNGGIDICGDLTPDEAWNRVITDVERASFQFGEPDFFYIFQVWSLGFDNARISQSTHAAPPTLTPTE